MVVVVLFQRIPWNISLGLFVLGMAQSSPGWRFLPGTVLRI